MFCRILNHLRSNALAWTALFVACGGTSLAASRYIITSTKQIKPSVLKELQGNPKAVAAALAKEGVHSVVAKARSAGPIQAGSEPELGNDPMTGATWTQHSGEDNLLVGQVTVTRINEVHCPGGGTLFVNVVLDGKLTGGVFTNPVPGSGASVTETFPIVWNRSMTASIFESNQNTSHTVTAEATDNCVVEGSGEHFKVDAISLDVIGVH